MQEPTHAPGWRGRPRLTGPISDHDTPATTLEAILYTGIGALAFLIVGGAIALWLIP